MFWIIYLIVFIKADSQFKTVTYPVVSQQFYKDSTYVHTIPTTIYNFGSNVLENTQPIGQDALSDYSKNPKHYKRSLYCWLSDVNIDVKTIAVSTEFQNIDLHAYSNTTLYILTNNTIKQLQIQSEAIKQVKSQIVNGYTSTMMIFNGSLYLSGQTSVANNTQTIPNGYILPFRDHVILLTQDTVQVYQQILKTKVDHRQARSAYYSNNLLYVLDSGSISIYKNGVLNRRIELQFNCESLTVINQTIEAVCQYGKKRFIAEFKDEFNRFYDVQAIDHITHHQEIMYVVGRHQISFMSHSIDRAAYNGLDYENTDTFPSYGVQHAYIVDSMSNSTSILMVGVTDNQVKLLRVVKKPPKLTCDFSSRDDPINIVVEIYSRHCQDYATWVEQEGKTLCKAVFAYNFSFKSAYESKTSRMIEVAVVLVATALIFFILGQAAKWKGKMNMKMRQMHLKMIKKVEKSAGFTSEAQIVSG